MKPSPLRWRSTWYKLLSSTVSSKSMTTANLLLAEFLSVSSIALCASRKVCLQRLAYSVDSRTQRTSLGSFSSLPGRGNNIRVRKALSAARLRLVMTAPKRLIPVGSRVRGLILFPPEGRPNLQSSCLSPQFLRLAFPSMPRWQEVWSRQREFRLRSFLNLLFS